MKKRKLKISDFGIPTGLIKKENFKKELKKIKDFGLGALEVHEDCMFLLKYAKEIMDTVSIHGTSDNKPFIKQALEINVDRIILHPTELDEDPLWKKIGEKLLIENLDPKTPIWRTAQDLEKALKLVPEANICFDIAHVCLEDKITKGIIEKFKDKIKQIHFSEVNPLTGEHFRDISPKGLEEIKWIKLLGETPPIILELKEETDWNETKSIIEKLLWLQ